MKQTWLLITLYVIGIFFIIDIQDNRFVMELFYEDGMNETLFTILLIVYAMVLVMFIFCLNLYLMRHLSRDSSSFYEWALVVFLPVFILALLQNMYGFVFERRNYVEWLEMISYFTVLVLVVGVFLFSLGHIQIKEDGPWVLNHRLYLIINILAFLTIVLSYWVYQEHLNIPVMPLSGIIH